MVQIKTGDGLLEIRRSNDEGYVCDVEYSDVDCGLMLSLTLDQVKEIREGLKPFETK